MGLPDRLHHVVDRRADGATYPQGKLCRGRIPVGTVVVLRDRRPDGLSALSLFAAVRHGPITLVAPLAAIYPLVTLLLSAIALRHVRITARIVAGAVLTVLGVALVLIG